MFDNSFEQFLWNPVFKLVIELKKKVLQKTGEISYAMETVINNSGGKKKRTCVEVWASLIANLTNEQKYLDIFQPLEINQDNNLVLFRYANHTSTKNGEEEVSSFDNSFWDLYDGIYRECRSVVIDVVKEQIVIAPFKKFMNLNQNEEYSLDNVQQRINKAVKEHKPVEITTKLDGSMQCANFYEGNFIMTGAQAVSKENSWRLTDGYDMLMQNKFMQTMIRENPLLTFIFEYISLKDAHVVKYTKEQEGLYLIGIRENEIGKQWSYAEVLDMARLYHVQLTTDIHDENLNDVLNNLDKYKSNEAEGVVLNVDGFLVKIKYNDYVKIHRVLSAISSPNLIIEAYADGWIDDLLSKIPDDYKWRIVELVHMLEHYEKKMNDTVEELYNSLKAKYDNIADFMKGVNQLPQEYRRYVIETYKKRPFSYFKTQETSKTPHYKNLSELGLQEEYSKMLKEQVE